MVIKENKMKRIRYTNNNNLLTSNQWYLIEYQDKNVEVQVNIDLTKGLLTLISREGENVFTSTDLPSKLKKLAKYALVQMGYQFDDEVRNRLKIPEMYV